MENAWKTDFTNANGLVDPVIYREIFLKTNTNFFWGRRKILSRIRAGLFSYALKGDRHQRPQNPKILKTC